MKLIPFDLEKALNGYEVRIATGELVEQFTVFEGVTYVRYCLYGVCDGKVLSWTREGEYFTDHPCHNKNLRLVAKEKIVWVNFYDKSKALYYDTEEASSRYCADTRLYGRAFPVVIEE